MEQKENPIYVFSLSSSIYTNYFQFPYRSTNYSDCLDIFNRTFMVSFI